MVCTDERFKTELYTSVLIVTVLECHSNVSVQDFAVEGYVGL